MATTPPAPRPYFKDFGPRIGFAYAPEQLFGRVRNIVIRVGMRFILCRFPMTTSYSTIQISAAARPFNLTTSSNKLTPVQALSAAFRPLHCLRTAPTPLS